MSIDYNEWGEVETPLPNDVITREPAFGTAEKLPDGQLLCHACCRVIPDNSAPGYKPSCPNCWTGLDLTEARIGVGANDRPEENGSERDVWRRLFLDL
jgi:hypothetical protein